jgi:hypothetical protein
VGVQQAHKERFSRTDNIVRPRMARFIVLRCNERVEHYKVTPMMKWNILINDAIEGDIETRVELSSEAGGEGVGQKRRCVA